jgi:hypothetical protein
LNPLSQTSFLNSSFRISLFDEFLPIKAKAEEYEWRLMLHEKSKNS